MRCRGVLRAIQFVYRKVRGACGSLLCVSHTLQGALKKNQEAGIFQSDLIAAFDRVKH